MLFQNQSLLDGAVKCPPDYFFPKDRNAYRLVFPKALGKSFIPLGLMTPPRVRPFGRDNSTCLWYSLSMYDSIKSATLAFEGLNKNNKVMKRIKKGISTIGNGVAVAQLRKDHGIMDEPNHHSGHFDFFPYENIKMESLFSLECEL